MLECRRPAKRSLALGCANCAGCDFVEHNVQVPGAGEIDVVGLLLRENRAYVCEVASHIHGLQYKNNEETIVGKFKRAKEYVDDTLLRLDIVYEFWSPVVRGGAQDGLCDESSKHSSR